MPKPGECNQLLVTTAFTDVGGAVSSSNLYGSLTFSSSDQHPLRDRPAALERHSASTLVAIPDSENGTRPRLTRLLDLDGSPGEGASEEVASEASQGDNDIIKHSVSPNDSFAGVALRYGVSIAALRRANQLWPSDPIHLRTELFIPRGGVLPPRHKSTHRASAGVPLVPEPTPGLSSDPVASSFVAARNMIFSVLPARLSLDSLSSRASASEDHELDDFRAPPPSDPPFAAEGHELSTLVTPYTQHKRPATLSFSQIPPIPTNYQYSDTHHTLTNDPHSRSISSSRTVSLERLPRAQPFAVLPVRTSQLEPEPAMELPVRLSTFNRPHPTDGARRRRQLPLNRPRSSRYG